MLACCSTSLVRSASGRVRHTVSTASAHFCNTSAYMSTRFVSTTLFGMYGLSSPPNVWVNLTCDLPSQSRRHSDAQRAEATSAPNPKPGGIYSANVMTEALGPCHGLTVQVKVVHQLHPPQPAHRLTRLPALAYARLVAVESLPLHCTCKHHLEERLD